ncbi:MAG: hypothetical protein ABW006_07655 [Hyphomicrobium sp.]
MFSSIAQTKISTRKYCIILLQLLAVGFIFAGSPAQAASRNIEFSGQLDYATFRQAARDDETITIRESPGGTGAAAMALARVSKVVIDGQCNSACAWSFVRNDNACFTSRASFGFHAAHDPGTGQRLNAATSYWLSSVRPSLRERLGTLLSSSGLIRVSASDMRRYYGDRACGAKPSVQIAANLAAPKPKKDRVPLPRHLLTDPPSINSALLTPGQLDQNTLAAIALQFGNGEPASRNLPPDGTGLFFVALGDVPGKFSAKTLAEVGNAVLATAKAAIMAQNGDCDPKIGAPDEPAEEPGKLAYSLSLTATIDPKDVDDRIQSAGPNLHALNRDAGKTASASVRELNFVPPMMVAILARRDLQRSNAPTFPGPGLFIELCAIAPRRRLQTDLRQTP